ncbi:outer spore coat protein CotE [Salinibacillus xinjiangensis]|uniref:Outer spore coat protein CotE n=1 Tax=Salinibacillus xinjiangensis TaxID=1229268 RepID=A0A6G1X344_9BACI|nr:outer spore coat protein CotE [Salinibacillus xinjiangensis]MRG85320.1 outer spore coat protein CotE [Salinibacillus xinjiangensis]
MSLLGKEKRQIITKAVIGKGKRFTEASHTISPHHSPSSILGCWVINHHYKARKRGDFVEVSGSYDINVWYSFNDNTKTEVVTDKVTYSERIPLAIKDDNCITDDLEVIARATQQPNCLECKINDSGNKILVEVEKEFIVEVIGETKVVVKLDPHGYVETDDDFDYDELEAELADVNPDVSSSSDGESDR